jgi:hypothetical protein
VLGFSTLKAPAVALTLALTLLLPVRVWACGASAGGVAGLSGCSLDEHNEAVRKKWYVGVGGSFTSTAIRFDDDLRLDQTRGVALATLDYAPNRDSTLELGAGSLIDGTFERSGVEYDFSPGLLLLVGASRRLLTNDGARPFVLLGGQVAYVLSRTTEQGLAGAQSVGYQAFDVRFGPVVGWTFWNTLSPYVLARVFGGPVFWHYQGQSEVGGDVNHYQLGAGVSLLIAKRVSVYAEGVPLGEQTLAGGAGFTF